MTDAPQIALDLTKCIARHEYGQITVFQTWLLDETKQACLVLVATRALRGSGRVIPCMVAFLNAWRWDEITGDAEYALENAQFFAKAMGFNENDWRTVHSIASIVRNHLGDLCYQKPLDAYLQEQAVADAIITEHETGKTRDLEVKDYVH